jgi:hypothetical protein
MKTLLSLGCSNSSDSWGKTWPDFLSDSIDHKLFRASSNGAGNAFFIEKLNFVLQNEKIDLVIVQLTEPSRVVLGMKSNEIKNKSTIYVDGMSFNSLGCYTWNAHQNDDNINRITNANYKIDKFWFKEVSISEWINYKVCQDICIMQYLCDKFNKPVIFFSWFVNFDDLFVNEYKWLKNNINYIDGSAMDIFNKNMLQPDPKCADHFNADANKFLVDEWLLPQIRKFT